MPVMAVNNENQHVQTGDYCPTPEGPMIGIAYGGAQEDGPRARVGLDPAGPITHSPVSRASTSMPWNCDPA
jgi:hypothetical protein